MLSFLKGTKLYAIERDDNTSFSMYNLMLQKLAIKHLQLVYRLNDFRFFYPDGRSIDLADKRYLEQIT